MKFILVHAKSSLEFKRLSTSTLNCKLFSFGNNIMATESYPNRRLSQRGQPCSARVAKIPFHPELKRKCFFFTFKFGLKKASQKWGNHREATPHISAHLIQWRARWIARMKSFSFSLSTENDERFINLEIKTKTRRGKIWRKEPCNPSQ